MLIRRLKKTRLLVVGGFGLLGVLNTGCSMAPGTPLIAPTNDRAIYGGNPPAVAVQPSPAFNNVAQGMNLPTGHTAHGMAQRQPVGPPVYGSGGAVVPIGYQPQPQVQPQPVQHPGYPQGYVPVMPHYQPQPVQPQVQPQPIPAQPSTGVIPASGQPQIQVIQTPQGPQYIIVEGLPAQPQPQPAPVQPSNPAGTPVSNTTPVAPGGVPSLSAPSPGFVPAPGLPAALDKSKGPELPTPPTTTTPAKEPTPGGPSIHEDDIPLAPGFLPQQR